MYIAQHTHVSTSIIHIRHMQQFTCACTIHVCREATLCHSNAPPHTNALSSCRLLQPDQHAVWHHHWTLYHWVLPGYECWTKVSTHVHVTCLCVRLSKQASLFQSFMCMAWVDEWVGRWGGTAIFHSIHQKNSSPPPPPNKSSWCAWMHAYTVYYYTCTSSVVYRWKFNNILYTCTSHYRLWS